jgi:quinol monooxygenase YgiN
MVSQQVRMTAQWRVPRAEMWAISAAIQSIMVATRAEPGCIGCSLSTRLEERAAFEYEEEWRTEDDLIVQLRSGRFTKLAHLMESATEQPKIEFTLPGGTRGLEYAEEVRGTQGETH